MFRSSKFLACFCLAAGALLGYGAATGKISWLFGAEEAKGPAQANGVQVTGELGSPSATTTIAGNQLPPAPPKFGGVIKESAKDSKTWWPPRVVPPKGAPNVLLIMTDDQGYGVSGTFGGHSDAGAGPDRQDGAALHGIQLHRALLADARRPEDRPQPPRG